ncbi:hypothetical protein [Tropicibacter alexandrii]|uniref:hypothetical protein n=1 Tax=Tropicibacter alexandrii TaxID=2267683 RepID=UPI001008CC62|nr:hypothetical protein [Tropicibacter alexandrii]
MGQSVQLVSTLVLILHPPPCVELLPISRVTNPDFGLESPTLGSISNGAWPEYTQLLAGDFLDFDPPTAVQKGPLNKEIVDADLNTPQIFSTRARRPHSSDQKIDHYPH